MSKCIHVNEDMYVSEIDSAMSCWTPTVSFIKGERWVYVSLNEDGKTFDVDDGKTYEEGDRQTFKSLSEATEYVKSNNLPVLDGIPILKQMLIELGHSGDHLN